MARYMGVEVEDFDPDDPHCFNCDNHLDVESPVVIVLLTHAVTGERKGVALCLPCALRDSDVRANLKDHRDHAGPVQHKDYLN